MISIHPDTPVVEPAGRHAKTGEPTPPHMWHIFATRDDRQTWMDEHKGEFNYWVGWKDVHGFGLHTTWALWVGEGNHLDLSD